MILQGLAILVCLILGFICVKLLIKGSRELDHLEGTPMNVIDDLEQPRSKLLKTITQLRSENETLRKQVDELQKQQEGR